MIEQIPWPQVVLGIAAALSILVIYDVVYVWPLVPPARGDDRALPDARAHAARHAKRSPCESSRSRRGSREHWVQFGERLGQLELMTDARSYEQAIGFAEQGEQADRLMTCFGLTEGEADLVRLLHGEKDEANAAMLQRVNAHEEQRVGSLAAWTLVDTPEAQIRQ